MKAIEAQAEVTQSGRLSMRVPPDIRPGKHDVIVIITDISSESAESATTKMPVDRVGAWPKGLSLSRKDLYGDQGR